VQHLKHKKIVSTQSKMNQDNSTDLISGDIIVGQVMIALRKIIRAIDMNSKKLVKRVGLTGPQLLILQEISRNVEITAGEIANAVSLSQATVTGILERMEKRELLTRQRSETDKRRIMVRITQEGKDILKNAPPIMQEAFVERFDNLQEWEQTMILSALQRLVAMMEAKAIEVAPFLEAAATLESNVIETSKPSL
jgi:DNA-binding MarR family transcriptional regulator